MLGYRGLKGIWCFLLNLVAHQSPTQDNNPKSYPVPGKSRDSQNRIAPVIFPFPLDSSLVHPWICLSTATTPLQTWPESRKDLEITDKGRQVKRVLPFPHLCLCVLCWCWQSHFSPSCTEKSYICLQIPSWSFAGLYSFIGCGGTTPAPGPYFGLHVMD